MSDVADRWTHLQTLFEAALDRPLDERTAWLRAECGDDPDLYHEVAALLAADDQPESVFDGRAADLLAPADLDAALVPSRTGERVGPWVLGERIGEGGMGTVYRAERVDAFEQTAAVKRLKPGMDSDALLARFRAERQILARLEHPGIARLLDGGLDADGRPYFAMELVEGEPLTDYADARRLGIGARLALFADVCEAVAYAHRNLVVHRDLKPSNVFVTDGGRRSAGGPSGEEAGPSSLRGASLYPSPAVKLLDFGIARVLSDDADDGLTRTGQRLLTPSYAAPEQVRGDAPTTATDVYALGGLLYRLLCGALPLDLDGLNRLDAERAVLDADPARPSTRVWASAAAARGTTEVALAKRLAGDLDVICLKALRKEPERRYGSAAELLADVRRHLGGLPVEARPATVRYRAGLFVRRHRAGVLGVAAALALVTALVGFYTARLAAERDRATTEATTAREVSAFLASVLDGADPLQSLGDTLSAFDLLDRGAARIRADLAGEPEVQAEMLLLMGNVYENLGRFDQAEPLLRDALRLRRELWGDDHLDVAEAQRELGALLRQAGDADQAEPLLRAALATLQRRAPDAPDAALTMRHLASLVRDQGDYETAERLYRQALAIAQPALGAGHPDVTDIQNSLSILLEATGRFDEAAAVMREVVAAERSQPQPYPPLSGSLATLGNILREQGDLDGAEAMAREALAIDRAIFGEDHPRMATALRNLGSILRDRGRYDAAAPLYDDALRIRRAALGPDHPRVANLLNSMSLLYMDAGDPEAALAASREALRIYEAQPEPDPSRVAPAIHNLASLYEELGRPAEAERLYRRSLAGVRRVMAPGSADLAFPLVSLGTLLTERRPAEAVEVLTEAVAIRRAALPPEHRYTALAERRLSDALVAANRPAEARGLLAESLRRLRASDADTELVERARARLADLPVAVRATSDE